LGRVRDGVYWVAGYPTASQASQVPPSVSFIDEFAASLHDGPEFFRGTYQEALEHARRQRRLLFVYLHAPEHENTERFKQ
jgi:hypothetical protein